MKPPSKTMSSRQFNQDTAGAKRLAEDGPVFITDRARITHVLMTRAEYEQKTGERLEPKKDETPKPFVSLADMLADPRPETEFDFEFPEHKGSWGHKIPDFSED
jgi:hypothetical protein